MPADKSYLTVSDKVKRRLKSHEYAVSYVESQREAIVELEAEIKRLVKELGEATEYGADTLQQLLNATTEIKRLQRFLSIAIDAHDDEVGKINAEKNPKHWTVQARKALNPN